MILLVVEYILNKVLSIFGHILLDFMQIFQDGALPNLEYQFLRVIWLLQHLVVKVTVTNDTYSGKEDIILGT